ncbi:transporter, major facilitator family protein [Klebsiella pneumoniae subsp. ozaenae]|uniref:Transporter, major facilitator family protein n=1 Tax=Klebsiella pneumoniae subsp. ozaenae TaxID=574 RepID=A0A378A3K8_KLEPO|nr:transporter, major facilitator family protein [Klebsiella pneumoniae subsp. ozaenae]
MMSNTLLESVVKKNRARLIPFMLALYVLAFLDRSNIGFAKETYQLDTGLSNEAYALGAGIFFVVYAFLGVPANLLMRKFGARRWIGCTTLLWGVLSRRWRGLIRKRNSCWYVPCWARRRRASFPE